MVKQKQARRRNRRLLDAAVPPVVPFAVVDTVKFLSGTTLSITFSSAVMLSSIAPPLSWLFGSGNHQITAVSQTSAIQYTVTVDGTVAASQEYTIGAGDPNARTPTGGYVAGAAGTISA